MKNLDIFGKDLGLYYDNSSKFKTNEGLYLSLLLLLISIITFVYLGFDMFVKQKPSSYINVAINDNPSLNVSQLFFAIRIVTLSMEPIAESQRKFNFNFQIADGRKKDLFFQNLEMMPCNQTSFFQKNMSGVLSNSKLAHGGYYCIPDNIDFKIEGNYDLGIYSYAAILVQ